MAASIKFDIKKPLLPPIPAADAFRAQVLGGELEGGVASPALKLLRCIFMLLSSIIPGGWGDFMDRANRAIFTSEQLAEYKVQDYAWDDAFDAEETVRELGRAESASAAGGGPHSGGGSSAAGGGGGTGAPPPRTSASGSAQDILRLAIEASKPAEWTFPQLGLSFFTLEEGARFSLGRQGAPMEDECAGPYAESLRMLMLQLAETLPAVLPRKGGPLYVKKDMVSNVGVNNKFPPLHDRNLWHELVMRKLPADCCIAPHGPKGVTIGADKGVKASEVDCTKAHGGLQGNQLAFSALWFHAIMDAIKAPSTLILDVLPDMRWDWEVDGLHNLFTAPARFIVFVWLHLLLCWGVCHTLVVTAAVRRLILHVALCCCDKVNVQKHTLTRTAGGKATFYEVHCLYLYIYGVSMQCVPPFPPPPPPRSVPRSLPPSTCSPKTKTHTPASLFHTRCISGA